MIKNYFKTALRNLWRHKGFSFLNVLGLAVGMTACALIVLYVTFELSYDSMHKKSDRIYRIICDIKTPTEVINASGPSWAVAPHIDGAFPEIESAVRVSRESFLVRRGDVKFQEDKSAFVDSAFFHVFDFELVKGDRRTALNNPFSVVLSESTAKKYFGSSNPVGQTLLFTGDAIPAKVTGVMKDIPENSQIRADLLISMSTLTRNLNKGLDDQWGNYGSSAYVLLKPGTNAKALEKKLPAFLEKMNGKQMKDSKMYATLFLEPLRDVYLYSTRDGSKTGNITNVYIFSMIAVFILAIACINFINLTTARSTERAKEVGIRKVVGAVKSQLAGQFIGESIILCLTAFIFTLIVSALLLPLFNQLAGKTVSSGIFSNLTFVGILFIGSIIIGFLAGLYPALILASFKPVLILKGRFSSGSRGILLRKVLVVTQFTISISLIIGTIIVYKQMSYMRSQDLGFNKDQVLILDTNGDKAKKSLKEEISRLPNIKSIAMSSSVPGGGNPGAYSEIENKKGDLQVANLDLYFVDFDYITQFNMKMVAGRPFQKEFATDTTQAMVLNEAAVKMFGYSSPDQALGKRFKQWGREGKIVGVVKDFHFRSLQENIKPLSMRIEPDGCNLITVKIAGSNLPGTIRSIESKWKELIPNRPFSYEFLDEFFDSQYRAQQRFGNLFLNFAVLAIFISCLGLLGLASYSTMQRTREIGIRKVMGASVSGIVNLLSVDFLKLVLVAFVIASPIAWLTMHYWLSDFAYRINIVWWIFALAGITAAVIAFVTISFQAIKAALTNPVKSLRTE
ncbi:FtsX-like permease family protein [Pedobacter sp. HMF7647]|uniref:FtsX-like permease family protein n=1 Tax=Hufsiella arboris TaxID=2695275 RepID=A0A7K1YA57_9SPHI|nr:ABC transporter permease [Hufsiella arboris]MXV51462.1 FtsX-like permease family protein [Hufsiella arboris]